jgi:Protein of unknown function (DUF1573)
MLILPACLDVCRGWRCVDGGLSARRVSVPWLIAAALAIGCGPLARPLHAGDHGAAPASAPQAAEPVEEEGPPPPLVAAPAAIDFGRLPPGSVRETTLQVSNPTAEPLKVRQVRSTCNCTTVEPAFIDHVLRPGESIEMKVTIELDAMLGPKTMTVYVIVEDWDRPLEIPVTVEAVLAIRTVPAVIKFQFLEDEVPQPSGVLVVESLDGTPFTILSSGGTAPRYTDGFTAGDAPRTTYQVRYDLSPWVAADPSQSAMPWWWVIETDHPAAPLVDVRIRGAQTAVANRDEFVTSAKRPWGLAPDLRSVVGVVKAGAPVEFVVTTKLRGGMELASVQTLTPGILTQPAIVKSRDLGDGEIAYTVRVTPAARLKGVFLGLLLFKGTDNHQLGRWVIGTVR